MLNFALNNTIENMQYCVVNNTNIIKNILDFGINNYNKFYSKQYHEEYTGIIDGSNNNNNKLYSKQPMKNIFFYK